MHDVGYPKYERWMADSSFRRPIHATVYNDVFNPLRGLYGKRINIVHGIRREVVTWSDYHSARDYLRDSLKSCLALGLDSDKEGILSLIDQALVNPSTREKLSSAVKEGLARLGW